MNRRNALHRLLWAGAVAFVPGVFSCKAGRHSVLARPRRPVRIDDSFARLLLRSGDLLSPDLRKKMLSHSALAALLRHQHLMGNQNSTSETLLDSILESVNRTHPTSDVLDAWAGREAVLSASVEDSAHHLPEDVMFKGTVYFVIGYDIGVATPPDLALNVGHEHFLNDSRELGFYATHEAHHVGFMTVRRPPALVELNKPKRLRDVIRYMTQLEGMGVHAVFNARARHDALSADDDYRIYTDRAEGQRVITRYAKLISKIQSDSPISDDDVGTILNDMSSGKRIWYRFGALVSWTLERTRGRGVLIQSIRKPDIFWDVAEEMIQNEPG